MGLQTKVKYIPPFITNDSMIADGVIVASKISVTYLSDISGDFGTITAGSITGIDITGGTITGTVIQTASNYPRVSLNQVSDSMTVYDGSGNSVVQIAGVNSIGGLLNIAPSSTSAQAISIEMPSSSNAYAMQITTPGSGSALFIGVSGSAKSIEVAAQSSNISNPMVVIGDGGYYRNLMQLVSSFNSNSSYTLLDLQVTAGGAGTVINIHNQGIAPSVYINQINALNTNDVIYITSTHGGRVMEIEQGNSSNSNTVLYVTTNNTTVAPIFATGGYADVGNHFARCLQTPGGAVIWGSDGTNPNGAVSANRGDICLNGPSGVPYYCTGGTSWTAL